jgi:hypothetical protein
MCLLELGDVDCRFVGRIRSCRVKLVDRDEGASNCWLLAAQRRIVMTKSIAAILQYSILSRIGSRRSFEV